ncbi:6-phosphogluconolactonase [Corynebacterium anserum]|uniref:6-phosphogluconolactonase n=1 Tax=Corynebacterium anserum TaxID=2684406 RepID=A0A7G7YNF9_9CORY|nr:6-phosphogluconolactonase [Corynebacterium anserum]MBC2681595.1 6-phosphogluconolactonase [Corynebacterium anserum]QNH96029.1 6-phosphogluconolactonase [Corynebacterium anserum]
MSSHTASVPEIRVLPNKLAVASAVAREFWNTIAALQRTGNTVHDDGVVRVVLTGGTVGIETLRQILLLDHAAKTSAEDFPITTVDWNRVLVFFGDERFLPTGNPDRNDTQAFNALLRHIDIPRSNVFPFSAPQPGEAFDGENLDLAAESYCRVLGREAPEGFDIHLLGMGPEGHVNSLFPQTPELLSPTALVQSVRGCPKPPAERVTLTLDAIATARRVWLIVAGKEKKEAAVHAADRDSSGDWPAGMVQGADHTILWVDHAADPGTD